MCLAQSVKKQLNFFTKKITKCKEKEHVKEKNYHGDILGRNQENLSSEQKLTYKQN